MKFQWLFPAVLLVSMAMVSCGEKSSSSSSGSVLEGSWATECTSAAEKGLKLTAVFAGSGYVIAQMLFEEPATCVTPLYAVETRGTFVIGDISDAESGARKIDYAQREAVITPQSDSAIAALAGTCGINSWIREQSQSILGKTNCGVAFEGFAATKLYDIFKVTAGTNLNFGSEASGNTTVESLRPTVLDQQTTFLKM